MARIHTINDKTSIWVYAGDHLPPHFHIISPDFEALVEIDGFAFYAGEVKGSAGKLALAWAKENIETIKAEWNRVNPKFPVKLEKR